MPRGLLRTRVVDGNQQMLDAVTPSFQEEASHVSFHSCFLITDSTGAKYGQGPGRSGYERAGI